MIPRLGAWLLAGMIVVSLVPACSSAAGIADVPPAQPTATGTLPPGDGHARATAAQRDAGASAFSATRDADACHRLRSDSA
ncbi:MAG: hypothetical protein M5U01_34700 [Ardenticatenaceae bacterium]|nr:hypothetical protein [Ardenticatenaceae bacterium]